MKRWANFQRTWIDQRTWPTLLFLGLIALSACATLSALSWPVPLVHDEFSYLLAGQTFAEGRLTNPPLPFPDHFETFGVLQHPTYMSKYPPLPGMFLAVGYHLGNPIFGVWLTFALVAMSAAWMLRQWIGPLTGLIGGLLVSLHGQMLIHWGSTFYAGGGALASAAACLSYGALPSFRRRPNTSNAFQIALGVVCLLLSRPYEGGVASLPLAAVVAHRLLQAFRANRRTVLLPSFILSFVISSGFAFQAYYNFRVTGNAMQMPYQLHHATYSRTPLFLFQSAGSSEPTHRSTNIKRFDEAFQQPQYDKGRHSISLVLWKSLSRILMYCQFYLGTTGVLFLVGVLLWYRHRDSGHRFIQICLLLIVPLLMVPTFGLPHYAGPLLPLLILLIAFPTVRLAIRSSACTRWFITGCALLVCGEHFVRASHYSALRENHAMRKRKAFQDDLLNIDGLHLVFIRYSDNHDSRNEWIANERRLAESRIVWAASLESNSDACLEILFPERRIWRIMVN